jgi:ferredoxin
MLSPKTWQMNDEDGKSDLANAKWKGDEFMVSTIDENEYEENKKAADACPVNIIRVN